MTNEEFREIIIGNYLNGKNIVLVNIGTEKYIGDSFAPLLGSMLQGRLSIIKSYGNLDNTINGVNLLEKINIINKKHSNDLIIGVDSIFSKNKDKCAMDFSICEDSFIPGQGVNKENTLEVGHITIQFCINKGHEDGFEALKMFTIRDIYNRVRSAAELIFDIDEELLELNNNINNNRQDVK